MNIFEAVILGIIQGLTEFLPVSSSGHLALTRALTGIDVEGDLLMAFDVLLHVATLIPVCIIFRKTIFDLIKNPFQKTTLFLIIGTVPTVIAALVFRNQIDFLFSGAYWFLAITFTITGVILLFADWAAGRAAKNSVNSSHSGEKTVDTMTWKDAAIIGCAQAFAIPPGISRSGTTIAASLGLKFSREEAAKFIFLLSIPAIIGGSVLEVANLITRDAGLFTGINPIAIIMGFIAAALSGYLAIRFFLALIKKARLRYFSIYVFALALFIAVDMLALNGRFLSNSPRIETAVQYESNMGAY